MLLNGPQSVYIGDAAPHGKVIKRARTPISSHCYAKKAFDSFLNRFLQASVHANYG